MQVAAFELAVVGLGAALQAAAAANEVAEMALARELAAAQEAQGRTSSQLAETRHVLAKVRCMYGQHPQVEWCEDCAVLMHVWLAAHAP